MKYKNKQFNVEAVQWTDRGLTEVPEWIKNALNNDSNPNAHSIKRIEDNLVIRLGIKEYIVEKGDYIVQNITNNLIVYPEKDFKAIFEAVQEDED